MPKPISSSCIPNPLCASDDIGLIKLQNKGLRPGLGVNKSLGEIGDVSVIGIVATKTFQNYSLFNTTRLNLVYKMATKIAEGITDYIDKRELLRAI